MCTYYAICSLGDLLCMTLVTAKEKNGRNAKNESHRNYPPNNCTVV